MPTGHLVYGRQDKGHGHERRRHELRGHAETRPGRGGRGGRRLRPGGAAHYFLPGPGRPQPCSSWARRLASFRTADVVCVRWARPSTCPVVGPKPCAGRFEAGRCAARGHAGMVRSPWDANDAKTTPATPGTSENLFGFIHWRPSWPARPLGGASRRGSCRCRRARGERRLARGGQLLPAGTGLTPVGRTPAGTRGSATTWSIWPRLRHAIWRAPTPACTPRTPPARTTRGYGCQGGGFQQPVLRRGRLFAP